MGCGASSSSKRGAAVPEKPPSSSASAKPDAEAGSRTCVVREESAHSTACSSASKEQDLSSPLPEKTEQDKLPEQEVQSEDAYKLEIEPTSPCLEIRATSSCNTGCTSVEPSSPDSRSPVASRQAGRPKANTDPTSQSTNEWCDPSMPRSEKSHFTWHSDEVIGPLLSLREKMGPLKSSKDGHLQLESLAEVKRDKCMKSTESSSGQYGDSSQTLMFLDWDDTLFPTTYLFEKLGLPKQSSLWASVDLPEEVQTQLQTWRETLRQYLLTACSLSKRVAIVTNAREPWVADCIDNFAPNVKQLFEQEECLLIIYARESIAARHQNDTTLSHDEMAVQYTKAKYNAMRQQAKSFYSQYADQTWKNIISVGDAAYEHDALQDVAFHRKSPARENIRVKTFLTPGQPTLVELISRMKLAIVLYPAYVYHDGDIDLDMNTPERMQAIADALDMPEMKDVIASIDTIKEGDSEEEKEWLTERQTQELAVLVHEKVAS